MRIIFIPGFGEDERIFSKLTPLLPGDKVVLNSWKLLGDEPRQEIDVLELAKEVIDQYQLTNNDVIIGHSMGGWIAYHLKHLINCPIVQISSWTDSQKIIPPVIDHSSIYWAVKKGLVFNQFTKRIVISLDYNNKPSKQICSAIFDDLISGNKDNVNNQLKVNFTSVKETILVQPDLRIHAKADRIVKPPSEEFYEVPGDHFSLYVYPEEVYLPIKDFLNYKKSL
jgi:hypothetical protein